MPTAAAARSCIIMQNRAIGGSSESRNNVTHTVVLAVVRLRFVNPRNGFDYLFSNNE